MNRSAILAVINAGFSVYMRDLDSTYMVFTDGTNIGYLQNGAFGGFDLSTVHIPNRESGSGYRIADGLDEGDLTRERLSEAFIHHAPSWARSDTASVRKYKSMDGYRAADAWNAGMRLIERDSL